MKLKSCIYLIIFDNVCKASKTRFYLVFFSKSKPSVIRSIIIKDADKDFIDCVSECCCNVLKGNVALTQKQKSKLLKYKTALRSVAKKSTSLKRKKALIAKRRFLISAHRTLTWCSHSSCVQSFQRKIMETVQKLALVDPRILESLQNKQPPTVLSNLDKEMQQILRQKILDEEKIALYQQILQSICFLKRK